ncbi:hypothetical protein D3C77_618640 [compost metagenome]
MLLGRDPASQRVFPAQDGLVRREAGDLEQLAQAGLHLFLGLLGAFPGSKGRAVEVLLLADPLTADCPYTLAHVVQQAPALLGWQAKQCQLFLDAELALGGQAERITRHG